MKTSRRLSSIAVSAVLATGVAVAGCGSDSDEPVEQSAPAVSGDSGTTDTGTGAADGRAQAEQVALSEVEERFGGPATVTGVYNEDDGGARWEVEVTRSDGSEFDVLVSANGEVIRVVTKGGSGSGESSDEGSGGQQTGGSGSVSRQQAGQIAVAYMEQRESGSGRVTYGGPEDDAGARWEIEVTMDGGREFDVLVSASGEVIRVK